MLAASWPWAGCGTRPDRSCAKSARPSARTCRSSSPVEPRSGWVAARRSIPRRSPAHFVVIVRPPFGVSTASLFLVRRGPHGGLPREPGVSAVAGAVASRPRRWSTISSRRHARPRDRRSENPVARGGAMAAAMSGSGSAVFGLFLSRAAAARGCPCRETAPGTGHRTLTRAEHERRAVGCPSWVNPIDLSFCGWPLRPGLGIWHYGSPNYQMFLGRGQAVRRGTLDPVFGGSILRPNHASKGVCVITTVRYAAMASGQLKIFSGARTVL